jgi:ABC-type uncharacterized transport system permease subunit
LGLLNGTFVFLLLQLAFIIPVFWTHSVNGFRDLNWNFVKVSERPDGIFSGWLRKFFVFVLPYCVISSLPARLIIDGPSLGLVGQILGSTAVLFGAVLWFWRSGLKAYSSASS